MNNNRYYAFDSLRVIAIFAVLFFHVALNYVKFPAPFWPMKDNPISGIFDLVTLFFTSFQMPLFFMISGFFTALLVKKRGIKNMLQNRIIRVLVPLVIGWILFYPFIKAGLFYAKAQPNPEAFQLTMDYVKNGLFSFESGIKIAHFWFLYYLAMLLPVVVLLDGIGKSLPAGLTGNLKTIFEKCAGSMFAPLLFCIPVSFILMTTKMGVTPAPSGVIPNIKVLAAKGLYFYFGYLLFSVNSWQAVFQRHAWFRMILGMAMFVVAIGAQATMITAPPEKVKGLLLIVSLSSPFSVWLIIFGLAGLCMKYLNREIRWIRYVSDASYWTYLIHFPITIWLPAYLYGGSMPSILKFLIVLTATFAFSLITYHLMVRSTIIGWVINGKIHSKKSAAKTDNSKAA